MATDYELEILARYSTPGLRRNQFTRWGKQMHLAMINRDRAENEKILAMLYPPERDDFSAENDPFRQTAIEGKGATEE